MSLIVEVPVVLLLTSTRQQICSTQLLRLSAVACFATLLTHPFAWTGNLILMFYAGFISRSMFIEAAVILVEGVLYWLLLKVPFQLGIYLSAIANTTSFLVGLAIYYLS